MIKEYKSKKYYIGAKFTSNNGDIFSIIGKSKERVNYYWIQFNDENKHIVMANSSNIKNGKVRNPYSPTICGVGYNGVGEYNTCVDKKLTRSYVKFIDMISRVYDGKDDSYKKVTVCKEWHNYQNFAKWFEENYIEGYHLDKDLLQHNIENKIYSPETCIFIPSELNNFLSIRYSTNTSGLIGVCKKGSMFQSQISIDGKNTVLGVYNNSNDASNSYIKKRNELIEKWKNKMYKIGYSKNIVIKLDKHLW